MPGREKSRAGAVQKYGTCLRLHRDRAWNAPGRHSGGLVLTELAVIIAAAAFCALIFLPVLSGELEAERRAECLNNLRKVGQAMSAYAADYGGYYPHAWRGENPVQVQYRTSDYWGSSPASLLLTEGYAGESGKLFRCPSYVPGEQAYRKNIPVYRGDTDRWTWETATWELPEGTTWYNTYPVFAGYLQHEGGTPEIITDWYLGSHPARPFPDYKVAVRDTASGKKALAGDVARGIWNVSQEGNHRTTEGLLAGANFVFIDGSVSWHTFTGFNHDSFAHYSVPANSGHTAGFGGGTYFLPIDLTAD